MIEKVFVLLTPLLRTCVFNKLEILRKLVHSCYYQYTKEKYLYVIYTFIIYNNKGEWASVCLRSPR